MDNNQKQLSKKIEEEIINIGFDPLLIVAGPGTGKTALLAKRAKRILDNGLAGTKEIFVLSFTNSSVKDIREQLDKFKIPQDVRILTVHKFAYMVVLSNLEKSNFKDNFYLAGSKDDILVLKDSLANHRMNDKSAKQILNSKIYEKLATMKQAEVNNKFHQYKEFYNAYNFYEITKEAARILKIYPEIRQKYFKKIKFLIVDEYQDLNVCDQEFIDILTNNYKGLTLAGDDDQSIYGFRYAYPDGIRSKYNSGNFINKNWKYCWRCPYFITKIANFIRKNDPKSISKELIKEKSKSKGIIVSLPSSQKRTGRNKEAEWVAFKINKEIKQFRKHIQQRDKKLKILVLASENKVYTDLKKILRKEGISFITKNPKLLNYSLIRKIFNILRFISDSNDNLAVRWILKNFGVNGELALQLVDKAIRTNKTLWQVIDEAKEKKIKSIFQEILSINPDKPVIEVIRDIMKILGIIETSKKEIKQLLEVAKEAKTLEKLFEVIISETLDPSGAGKDEKVIEKDYEVEIMTLHYSKGLTADIVFIMGLENGIFPRTSRYTQNDLRLFYVGLTRAKEKLYLTYVRSRADDISRGTFGRREPSEFIKLIWTMSDWRKYVDFQKIESIESQKIASLYN